MDEKDTIKKLFSQISDLVRTVKENPIPPGPIPEGIEEKLKHLENLVHMISGFNDIALNELGVNDDKIRTAMNEIDLLPEKERNLIQDAMKMKEKVDIVEQDLSLQIQREKKRKKIIGARGSQERKKRFRPMGGKKDWKPL